MTLNPTQNPSVKGVIYTTGSAQGNSNVLCAYSRVGSGKVAAIGDSSPPDDGTGDANDVLYNGYTLDAAGNHQKLLMNITIWLATSPPPPVASYTASTSPICSGQSVTFTSTSTGSPTVYAWSFPGGTPSTSSLANPVVVYNSSGVFNVTLVATNGSGSNTLTNPSSITVNSYPTIAAITGNTTICIGSTSILSETTSSGTWSSNSTAVATISSSGLVTGLTAGSSIINYYVTSNGCSSSQTSTITVNPLPVLTFSTFPIICLNGPAYSLTEGLPSGGQYTGTGITGTVFTPTIVGMTTISYTYADVNGCQSTEQTAINVNSCATIDEQAKESFTISPNPAQIEIKIQTGNEKIKQIKLFDNCGRMLQMKINYQLENQITIDLNTCINGVYYIQLFSENTVTSSKFIIDK
jgi:PKD repeat protein